MRERGGRPHRSVAGSVHRRASRSWCIGVGIVVAGALGNDPGAGRPRRLPGSSSVLLLVSPGLARPVSRAARRSGRPLPGRRRPARPRERRTQPPAHLGHGPGADDRGRPGGVHLRDQLVDPGVDRQDARRQLRRATSWSTRARSAWSACRRRWPTTSRPSPTCPSSPRCASPRPPSTATTRASRAPTPVRSSCSTCSSSRGPTSWRRARWSSPRTRPRATVWRSATRSMSRSSTTDGPERPVATVAGIYDDSDRGGRHRSVVLGLEDFTAAMPNSTDAQVFVQLRRRRVGGRGRARDRAGGGAVLDGEGAERRRVQGRHRWPARLLPQPDRRPAGVVRDHRRAGHRQHDRPLGARADPGAGSPPGRRDAPAAGCGRRSGGRP